MGYLKITNLYKAQDILLFKRCFAMEKIHGCLHKNTKVLLKNGETPIYLVKKGDLVQSFNEKTQTFEFQEINDVITQEITPFLDWYELELENGKKLICTEDHPILTDRGWITAKFLSEKDNIISIN